MPCDQSHPIPRKLADKSHAFHIAVVNGISPASVDWMLDEEPQLEVLLSKVFRLYGFLTKAQAIDRIEMENIAN